MNDLIHILRAEVGGIIGILSLNNDGIRLAVFFTGLILLTFCVYLYALGRVEYGN